MTAESHVRTATITALWAAQRSSTAWAAQTAVIVPLVASILWRCGAPAGDLSYTNQTKHMSQRLAWRAARPQADDARRQHRSTRRILRSHERHFLPQDLASADRPLSEQPEPTPCLLSAPECLACSLGARLRLRLPGRLTAAVALPALRRCGDHVVRDGTEHVATQTRGERASVQQP